MIRVLVWIALISFLIQLVYAGPGTHQYDTSKPHSNYGDGKNKKKHVEEHMKAMAKDGKEEDKEKTPDLSENDMIYYLFVIHDLNGDGYLDGHELRAAFTDFEGDEKGEHDHSENASVRKMETIPFDDITEMVDHVLLEDDKNGDGLISWSEYLESQLYHDPEEGK